MKIVDIHQASISSTRSLPIFISCIAAGFPSPADDYVENQLDLNELIVKHPSSTFFVRVEGESMRDAGILSGDILVVDRSIQPANGKIVVAVVDGEFTVKRIAVDETGISLIPENASFSAVRVNPESDFRIWGVVTYVIHRAQ